MSWNNIKEQLYTLLGNISIADGYNYDWATYRRDDTYQPESQTKVCATVVTPTDEPFEVDVSNTGEYFNDQFSRTLQRLVDIKCRIVSDALVVGVDEVVDENDEAIQKALDDLQFALGSNTLETCGLAVQQVNIVSAEKEEIDSNSIYYPYRLSVRVEIIYSKERRL